MPKNPLTRIKYQISLSILSKVSHFVIYKTYSSTDLSFNHHCNPNISNN